MAQISIETYRKIFLGFIVAIALAIAAYYALSLLVGEKVDVRINSLPQKAEVEFKGKKSSTPATFAQVKEGGYTVKIGREGYFERKKDIEVSKEVNEFFVRIYTTNTAPSSLRRDIKDAAEVMRTDFDKIFRFLPFANEKFRIEAVFVNRTPSIKISVLAIINRPEQFKSYKTQQKQFAREALEYIRSKKADPEKLQIIWFPENPL